MKVLQKPDHVRGFVLCGLTFDVISNNNTHDSYECHTPFIELLLGLQSIFILKDGFIGLMSNKYDASFPKYTNSIEEDD